jgi:hypothetical protein
MEVNDFGSGDNLDPRWSLGSDDDPEGGDLTSRAREEPAIPPSFAFLATRKFGCPLETEIASALSSLRASIL